MASPNDRASGIGRSVWLAIGCLHLQPKRRERAEAADKAKALWKRAQLAGADHPYLMRNGEAPTATLREIPAETAAAILGYTPKARGEALSGRLLVAPIKVGGAWSSAELIDEVGRKSAIAGGAKAGGYWSTGALPEGDGFGLTLAIVEGVATALTTARASGGVALAALSCGNLEPVALAMRERYPNATLLVGADLGNGQDQAEKAARAAGALLALPYFGPTRPDGASDFNDLAQHAGADAVRRCIEGAKAPGAATANAQAPDVDHPNQRRRARQRSIWAATNGSIRNRLWWSASKVRIRLTHCQQASAKP